MSIEVTAAGAAASTIVELLSRVLARHTEPGRAQVIFSGEEFELRVRDALRQKLRPGDVWSDVHEQMVRQLRNEMVHKPVDDLEHATLVQAWVQRALVYDVPRSDEMLAGGIGHDATAADAVTDAFVEHLLAGSGILGKLDPEEASRLGQRAAENVLAAAQWSSVVGDRIDTTQVAAMLGVSRQALAKRQQSGSLLGLAGDGTTWYPTWQFDETEECIRPEVRDLIGAFRDRLDNVDPLLIAAWATTNQQEDLDGSTPAQWLRTGRNPEQLRQSAERAAARLAR